jgi:hypothetical protein
MFTIAAHFYSICEIRIMIKYITHIIGLSVKVVKISRTFDCFVYVV